VNRSPSSATTAATTNATTTATTTGSVALAWLTPRRLRAQALLLAVCLWTVCAVNYSTPGLFDRAANIKFQDFLPTYVSARLIAEHRTAELYDQLATAGEMQVVLHETVENQPATPLLPNLYGPQVGLLFVPLAHFSFLTAARIWVTISLLIYFASVFAVWKCCPNLRPYSALVAISAIAYPPLFHFFVRGQLSALLLACFTAAYLAFRADKNFLAGLALGFLVFKPPFLLAIPLIFLFPLKWVPRRWRALGNENGHSASFRQSGNWPALAGLVLSASAQLAFIAIFFGTAVTRAYLDTLWHASRWIGIVELSLAPIQMHSLRSFWALLLPWPQAALALYVLCSILAILFATAVWRSSSPLAIRFSALTIAAVLANPHLFVYDLLVLAPVLLLLMDWTLGHAESASHDTLRLLLYLAFILPPLGPISRWTHLQLSVPAFAVLLWILWREAKTPGHTPAANPLASGDSRVV
jgi:alpha-1,2-mannosyltransferase